MRIIVHTSKGKNMQALITTTPATITTAAPTSSNAARAYLQRYQRSAGALRTMTAALQAVAVAVAKTQGIDTAAASIDGVRWERLTALMIEAMKPHLSHYATATVNKSLVAVRGVMRIVWLADVISHDEYARIIDATKTKATATTPAGRDVSLDEYAKIIDVCKADTTPAGLRDAAIVSLLRAGGLRRDELARIDIADYDSVNECITVIGKGNKKRVVYIHAAVHHITAWLALRGHGAGALFQRINKGGAIASSGITSQAVYNVIEKRGGSAGIKHFTPHDLRRSYVGGELDRGIGIVEVARQCGHASIITTARYDRRGDTAQKRAAASLVLP